MVETTKSHRVRFSLVPVAKGPGQNGFTLMEVMVALSVVAISLMAIYRMHSQTLFMDNRGRFDTKATMLARQKLADVNAMDVADLMGDAGDFGDAQPGYSWQIQSETVASDLVKEGGPSIFRIIVTIRAEDSGEQFQLTTYRHGYE